jgi:replicative DNA helicase
VPVPGLRKADLKVSAWNRIFDGIGNIKNRKIFIVDNPQFAVTNIRNVAERLVRDCGIRILIIDYLQLIEPFSKKRTREEEMASMEYFSGRSVRF